LVGLTFLWTIVSNGFVCKSTLGESLITLTSLHPPFTVVAGAQRSGVWFGATQINSSSPSNPSALHQEIALTDRTLAWHAYFRQLDVFVVKISTQI
jgi:hypothetical protein